MIVVDDAMFWDRVADMPAWEAEQELVRRRERLTVENDEMLAHKGRNGDEFGVRIMANNRQLTMLNERIKYLRNLQAKMHWKDAVRALFGQEAYEQCVVWIEQQYGHMDNQRREWAANGSKKDRKWLRRAPHDSNSAA